MADGDIDLYADVDEDFGSDEFHEDESSIKEKIVDNNEVDFKDLAIKESILSTTPDHGSATVPDSNSVQHQTSERRYYLYIGNLTWWTTEDDITNAVSNAGVSDLQEVKFAENKINGQSKGYCTVSVGSSASSRLLMEKLGKEELHGQTPVVTHATKQALAQFESQSKTRAPPQSEQQSQQQQQFYPPHGGPPRMQGPPAGMRGPPMAMHIRGPPPHIRGMPGGPPPYIPNGPPPPIHRPPPMIITAPPPMMVGMPPRGPPPIPTSGSAPYVNPAFFAAQGPPRPPGYPTPTGVSRDSDFEELMSRNRTVSSSAIRRAVQDASNNEFGAAIETLVTAISLIKQSKISNDDRCKILISSLEDTLRGIEKKRYGSRRERSRSRERIDHYKPSHSREREYSHRDHHREYREEDRSRSREHEQRRVADERYYEEQRRYRERAGGGGEEIERDRERRRERERPTNNDVSEKSDARKESDRRYAESGQPEKETKYTEREVRPDDRDRDIRYAEREAKERDLRYAERDREAKEREMKYAERERERDRGARVADSERDVRHRDRDGGRHSDRDRNGERERENRHTDRESSRH